MAPRPLPSSLVATLGLLNATACHPCLNTFTKDGTPDSMESGDPYDTAVTTCLMFDAPDTGDTSDTGDSGDSGDSGHTGDTGDTGDSGDTGGDPGNGRRATGECAAGPPVGECADPLRAVLDRQILPADVAARLRARRGQ